MKKSAGNKKNISKMLQKSYMVYVDDKRNK